MAGRKTRNNCPFCQHPERDVLERQVRTGLVDNEDLDKDQGWASGTVHRHMRRHSGEYYNNSNQDCSICTHPERSEIEAAIIDGRASVEDFAYELNEKETIITQHMEKHIKPMISKQVDLEMIPSALESTKDSLVRIEKNMNRLDRIYELQIDRVEEQFLGGSDVVNPKDVELAVKIHREVRDTLNDLAVWMDKVEVIDKNQSVSVITVIQAHFAEKSPDEWRVLRNALAEAGVLGE